MKNIYRQLAVYAALVLTIVSCTNKDGGWTPIELDKYEVTFGADGGEETIISTNYPGFTITRLENLSTHESANHNENKYSASMEGINLRAEGNKLTIILSASTVSRSWIINLAYYDASCPPVYVFQNAK
ncbi:MAG: hypothetical protein K5843_02770 [Bacteroidales bacterium]|nr:hypothetical protein [Bacteroidales bacterium]